MNRNDASREVRGARLEDVESIHTLLEHYAAMGDLLPRSKADIRENLDHFWVVGEPGNVIACGALEIFSDDLGEVRSLMVADEHKDLGLGKQVVEHIVQEARRRELNRLMALTYVPAFFHRLGFRTVPRDTFPEKVWGICVNCYKFHRCDEIAVLLEL